MCSHEDDWIVSVALVVVVVGSQVRGAQLGGLAGSSFDAFPVTSIGDLEGIDRVLRNPDMVSGLLVVGTFARSASHEKLSCRNSDAPFSGSKEATHHVVIDLCVAVIVAVVTALDLAGMNRGICIVAVGPQPAPLTVAIAIVIVTGGRGRLRSRDRRGHSRRRWSQ